MNAKTMSALVTLFSGIGLCTAGFIVNDSHELSDSLLFYMGECLVYAGAIFNVKLLILREIKEYFDKTKKT